MNKLKDIWNKANKLEKTLMVAGVVILCILLYQFITGLRKPTPQTSVSNASDEISALQASGQGPHYSPSQFSTWADTLQQAMQGYGTDEDSIAAVFKYMQNKADVLQLIKTFGVRDYSDDNIFFGSKAENLNQWLAEELNAADMQTYINTPLQQAGIDYQF